ncbi:HNH endonuclease signature motif containing protein, partial [Rhodococcus sp. KRD162]
TLGTHRGLPVTAIITMTLKDLDAGCGYAMTATGSRVSIRDAIRMASHAHHYLTIFDDDGRALYLGRSKRIASPDQRIVLIARDRGCSFPSCTRPATWCQAHHVTDWIDGGPTDIDSLTFGCDMHHALVGTGPGTWATTKTTASHRYPGRTL